MDTRTIRRISALVTTIFLAALLAACGPYHRHMKSGDEYFEQGQYERALAEYEAAKRIKPEKEETRRKIRRTRDRLVENYRRQARAELQGGNYVEAILIASEALDMFPGFDPVGRLVDEVTASTTAEAERLLGQRDYAGAITLYRAIYLQLPTHKRLVEEPLIAAKETWADELRRRAEAAREEGLRGVALLYDAKIVELVPDDVVAERRRELHDGLLAEHSYTVRPVRKGRKSAYRDAVDALEAFAVDRAVRVTTDADAEVDATVRIDAARPKFEHRRDQRTASERYVSGTRQVPNPRYDRLQDRLNREERELNDHERDVVRYERDVSRYQSQVDREGRTPNTTTGAEQNLDRARSNLSRAREDVIDQREELQRVREDLADEPRTRTEEVYSTHSYVITEHTLRATMRVDGTVEHNGEREPIPIDTTLEAVARDDAHPPQPIIDRPADPLDLPSEGAMAVQLDAEAAAVVRERVAQSFAGWRAQLLASALEASDDRVRLDRLVLYVLTDPTLVDPRAVEEIARISGIPEPVETLR
jgi:tetratricopeptide (TPR) repeat protein